MDNELMLDVGQANELKMAFRRADWTNADIKKLSEGNLAEQVLLVIRELATIVRVCFKLALDKAFDPSKFIGEKWTVWRGAADTNGLEGDEDCVLEPDVADFAQIILETHLQEGKTSVHGEEKMRRARAGNNQQSGGRTFLALWENWQKCKADGKPEESILEKLRRAKKIGNVIYFFGMTLRSPRGGRCVLYLFFYGRGWRWNYYWLGSDWDAGVPSASLASVK